MEHLSNEYLVFGYSDIFFSYYLSSDANCTQMVRNHALAYVYSGEYIIEEDNKTTVIHPGECVFLRRDNRVNMIKQPKGDEPFRGIFMIFKRNFLRDLYKKLEKKEISVELKKQEPSVRKLPKTPDITGLFQSMIPYFDSSIKPADEIMKLKLIEGVYSLLNIDENFYTSLFDFTDPWKIDILDFMNENYMYDLSIDEFASFTGRSLATFKRDFKKISSLPPRKWLMQKRLQIAHDKIRNEKKKVSEVYLEVGFKDLSHFSRSYKQNFGFSPTK